jgi:hypothetical protein
MRLRKQLFKIVLSILIWGIGICTCSAFMEKQGPAEIDAFRRTVKTDRGTIKKTRHHFAYIIRFMQNRPDLFNESDCDEKRMITQVQKNEIRSTWISFFDHVLAMDSLGKQYSDYYRRFKGKEKKAAFETAYAVFLQQYRFSLDFINLIEKDDCLDTILNEPDRYLGIPKNTYSKLKKRFLNVLRAAEFLRLNVVYQYYRLDSSGPLKKEIKEDSKKLFLAGAGKGTYHTLKNALNTIEETGFTAWFPVQKGVSQWMGDTKIFRPKNVLIHPSQIEQITSELQPGDILLERREWYLSNIGLPGFWTHAALYIGTPESRARFFDDPQVRLFLETFGEKYVTIDQYLKETYPIAYQRSIQQQEDSHRPTVIEAISEGVVFTTLQHSLAADSAAILRPQVSKKVKARAILRAFRYSGRPYDFNFDFLTDAELVCTELIYKSYEPVESDGGLQLPLKSMFGRSLLPANDIAAIYAKEYQTPEAQFVLVTFLDGNEHHKKAIFATEDEFLKSWERPKWHILFNQNRQE